MLNAVERPDALGEEREQLGAIGRGGIREQRKRIVRGIIERERAGERAVVFRWTRGRSRGAQNRKRYGKHLPDRRVAVVGRRIGKELVRPRIRQVRRSVEVEVERRGRNVPRTEDLHARTDHARGRGRGRGRRRERTGGFCLGCDVDGRRDR